MAAVTAFPFSRTVTIDTTSSAANISSSLTDFPVCVVVTSTSWGATASTHFFDASNTSGKRVQFYSGTTALSYEVEAYDAAGGTAIYWVKVPTVAGTATTSIIVGYGGDPNGSDQSNGTGVWDSNYVGVWHLNSTGNDSTTNGFNFTEQQSVGYTAGMAANGGSFDGTNDFFYQATNVNTALRVQQHSIEGWVRLTAFPGAGGFMAPFSNQGRGADSDGRGIDPLINSSGSLLYRLGTGSGSYTTLTAASAIAGTATWTHLVGTYNGTATAVYSQGSSIATASPGSITLSYDKGTGNYPNPSTFYLGAAHSNTGTGNTDIAAMRSWLSGRLDEVRLSKVARSADWLKGTYYSLKTTSWPGDNWITLGAEAGNARPYVLSRRQAVTRSTVF